MYPKVSRLFVVALYMGMNHVFSSVCKEIAMDAIYRPHEYIRNRTQYFGRKILKLGNERVNQKLCMRVILKSMFLM